MGGDVKAKSLDELSKEAWDHGISINLKMAFLVTRAGRPGTQEAVGHVCLFLPAMERATLRAN